MKAYRIRWPGKKPPMDTTLGYSYALPNVLCEECCPKWKSWGDGFFEFPALKPSFLNKKEFKHDRDASLDEFNRLKHRIEVEVGRSINLVPGCSIGELSGETFVQPLIDFVW